MLLYYKQYQMKRRGNMSVELYLKQLEKALFRLNPTERNRVMRDFHHYFFAGRREGKTDQEIMDSLGSANYIAEELLKAYSEEELIRPEASAFHIHLKINENEIANKITSAVEKITDSALKRAFRWS